MSLGIPLYRRRRHRTPWPLFAALALLLGALTAYLRLAYPTASPVASARFLIQSIGHGHAGMHQEVVGFLPYWRLDGEPYIRQDLVTDVVFFGLNIAPSGDFASAIGNATDPAWQAWNSAAIGDEIARTHIAGGRFELAIVLQKQSEIEALLSNNDAQKRLIDVALGQMRSSTADGLNLDFEVEGKVDPKARDAFTDFVTRLATRVHQVPGKVLSIDLPPLAARAPGLYDAPALGALADRVIVMSYDYYASGSDVAGPVAPMSGFSQGNYFFDVQTTYADYEKVVPKLKLIMGVPYYGYDWPVKDNGKPLAPTLPQNDADGYAEVLSYSRMKTDRDLDPAGCHWDDLAAESWCGYTRAGVEREAWFEDQRSVGLKYDFASSQGLAGVAIWTLGYDGAYPDLWSLVRQHFAA
ncbi:MAG: hypothetical protein JOZ39_06965 [Chloroflexi bacterium]|nr:hypothetical protein [Chloroflexota bacterium]